MSSTFVGIDLGTTNSVVAARNAYGRPEVIANREGQNITPSVVYFGTNPPAVGQEAKSGLGWVTMRSRASSSPIWGVRSTNSGSDPAATTRATSRPWS